MRALALLALLMLTAMGFAVRHLNDDLPDVASHGETVPFEPPLQVAMNALAAADEGASRNLFAYAAAPAPRAETIPPPMISAPVVAEPPAQPIEAMAVATTPPPPQFTWRFIGRFGPDAAQIAAFARAGEIVTVRAGERIDGEFVLRSIGIESVEVEHIATSTRISSPLAADGQL